MANFQGKPAINIRFTISHFIKSVAAASVLAAAAIPAADAQIAPAADAQIAPSADAQITSPKPDLNISFGSISQTPTVLGEPNKKGNVKVVVTNKGTAIYQGALNLNIYASPDGTLDKNPLDTPKVITTIATLGTTSNSPLQGTDELLGTLRLSSVKLTPNQSQTVTVDFTQSNFSSPSVVAPGSYYLFAEIDPSTPSQATNNNKVASQLINTGDPVIVWNATLLNAILESGISRTNGTFNLGPGTAPPLGARNQAIVHAAIYDAVNAIDQIGKPYAVTISRSDPRLAGGASAAAAASEAAYTTLVSLFPNQKATFDAQLNTSLAKISNGTAKNNGIAIGIDVANQIVALRKNDGAAQATIPYTGGNNPGEWRPTFPDFSPAVLAGFGSVTPFSSSVPPRNPSNPRARLQQFGLNGPVVFRSGTFVDQQNFVRQIGGFQNTSLTTITRNGDQTESALFWSLDRPDTFRPPGQWNEFAQQLALQKNNTLDQNALLFAQLNIAMADAGILTWDSKYTYNQLRPIQAIRQPNLTLDGSNTVRDQNWLPLLSYFRPDKFPNSPITPAFPDYNSGHAAFGGAAGQVLINFFGNNTPFSAPSQDFPGVARSFPTISAAIEDNAASRIYGGVHLPSSGVTRTSIRGTAPSTSETAPSTSELQAAPLTPELQAAPLTSIGVSAEGVASGTQSLDVTSDPEIEFGRKIGNSVTNSLF